MQAYYFGCGDREGHHLRNTAGRSVYSRDEKLTPWGNTPDVTLCPKLNSGKQTEGIAKLHHKEGWTAIAFYDRSVDSRGNSNSAFFFNATLTFDQAVAEAKRQFPRVWARFTFEVKPVTRYRTRDEAILAAGEELKMSAAVVYEVVRAFEDAVAATVPLEAQEA